ncbi:MAG: hypothetical protein K9L74_04645 [Candidatus Izimaplasma sp.]|nr:hypothetical protein [Candidatus Izimaplasma bacterium]
MTAKKTIGRKLLRIKELFFLFVMPVLKTFLKYWRECAIIIIAVFILRYNLLNYEEIKVYSYDGFDFVFILLPTLLTIISISLSLQNEKQYGLKNIEFRKILMNKKYNFMNMLLISLIIMVLFLFVEYFNLVLGVFYLMFISVFYAFLFIMHEIPLLLKNEKYIEKLIKLAVHEDESPTELDKVLKFMIFKKGIFETYNSLHKKNDKKLLGRLLHLQNEDLDFYKKGISKPNRNFFFRTLSNDLFEIIKQSKLNIISLLDNEGDFSFVKITGSSEGYYHITRTMFYLYEILNNNLKLQDFYIETFLKIIERLFLSLKSQDTIHKELTYKVFTTMIVHTLSHKELWFVKFLRNHVYKRNSIYYKSEAIFIFISIYIYYLINVEKSLSNDFKNELKKFIKDEPSVNNYNEALNSWEINYKSYLNKENFSEGVKLLKDLLGIFRYSDRFSWFDTPFGTVESKSIDNLFNIRMIFNWWIEYVLIHDFKELTNADDCLKILNKLEEEDKILLSKELNSWIEEEKVKDHNLKWADLYGIAKKIPPYKLSSEFVRKLIEFKTSTLKKSKIKEVEENELDENNFQCYKKKLLDGFVDAVNKLPFIDEDVELDDTSLKSIKYLNDSKYSDAIINNNIEQMESILGNMITDTFLETVSPIKALNNHTYPKEIIEKIISFNPKYKSSNIYSYDSSVKDNKIEKIDRIKKVKNLFLPRNVFIKDNAIKINIKPLKSLTSVRKLTSKEISVIIDRDYKIVNGYYMYNENGDSRGRFSVTREGLEDFLSKKLFFVEIVFKTNVIFDTKKIKYYK